MNEGFFSPIQVLAIGAVLALMYLIARLIAKGKLRAEYSFVWVALALVLFFFTAFRSTLDQLAALLGVYYAPSLLFIIFFFLIFIFLIHLSVVVSKHHEHIKKLTQENSLLKAQLEKKNSRESENKSR